MSDCEEPANKLSPKHQAFVNKLFELNFNGTRAYQAAYGCKEYTSRANASDLLTKPNIKAEIARRFAEQQMTADEALVRLADMARGDVAEFMDVSSVGWNVSLVETNEAGELVKRPQTKLIKRLKQKVTTIIGKNQTDEDKEIIETEIELYDAQAALEKILRIHGRFTDRVDVTTLGKSINDDLSDEQRADRIASILDAARARRTGPPSDSSG